MRTVNLKSLAVGLTTLLMLAPVSHAATFVWANLAGGNFSTTNNWSPPGVPGNGDTAWVTNAGTYTVIYDLTNNGSFARGPDMLLLGAGGGPNGVQTLVFTDHLDYYDTQGNYIITSGGVVDVRNSDFTFISVLVENGGLWNSSGAIYGGVPVEVTNSVFVSANDQFLGPVTLANGTQFITTNLFNDTIEPTSIWQVNTGAVVSIDTGVFLIEGFLTNNGTVNLQTNGAIQLVNNNDTVSPYVNGELINEPGGLINLYSLSSGIGNLKPGSGEGYELFINRGTVVRYNINSEILVTDFDNTEGTVVNLSPSQMQVGYFQAGAGNLAGNYYVTNGGKIQFVGGEIPSQGNAPGPFVTVVPPLTLAGPGQYALSSGYFELSNLVPSNLLLQGTTLILSTNFQGGAITNLSLDGITLSNTLPLTGVLNDTNSAITGSLTISNGGALNGWVSSALDCPVTVASGGVFNEFGGAVLNPPGYLTVASGGLVNLVNTFGASTLNLNAAVTNYGTIITTNNNGIGINDNGSTSLGGLVNAPGGVIEMNGNSSIDGGFGSDYLINQGSIVKNFNSGSGTISVSHFNTTAGTVSNLDGTLALENFNGALAGNFYASSGTLVQLAGGVATGYLTPGTPLALGGPGTYVFFQGYLYLPNDIVPGLVLQAGTLALGPSFQGGAVTNLALDGILLTNTLPVSGKFNVTNSHVYGSFTVANGGTLNAYSSANFYGGVVVASGGEINLQGAGTTFQPGGWLSVASGGTLDMAAALTIYSSLTNYGTINTTNNGISLATSQTVFVNEPGADFFTYGNGGVTSGGYLFNFGTITKAVSANQATFSVANFINSGALDVERGNFQLGAVSLQPAGSLNLALNSASDYGSFAISGNAALAGELNVFTNSYTPAPGTVFNVLNYGSYSGGFASVSLPPGVGGWQARYAPTVLQIETGLPHLAPPVLSPTNLVLSVTNGLAGNQYRLFTSTNLSLPLSEWTPLVTNAFFANGRFTFTNSAALLPAQFFLLESP